MLGRPNKQKENQKVLLYLKIKTQISFPFYCWAIFFVLQCSGQPKIFTNCSYWATSPTNKFGFNPFVCQFNIQCFRCITSCTNVRTLSTTSTEFRIFLTYCQKFLPSICTVCLNLSSCLALKPRRVCLKIENYHEVVLFWISWWKGLKKYRFLIKISFNRSK